MSPASLARKQLLRRFCIWVSLSLKGAYNKSPRKNNHVLTWMMKTLEEEIASSSILYKACFVYSPRLHRACQNMLRSRMTLFKFANLFLKTSCSFRRLRWIKPQTVSITSRIQKAGVTWPERHLALPCLQKKTAAALGPSFSLRCINTTDLQAYSRHTGHTQNITKGHYKNHQKINESFQRWPSPPHCAW